MRIIETEKSSYEKGDLIGTGAFARVYVAQAPGSDHQYAIALSNESLSPEVEDQLARGYSLFKGIRHENLVPVKESGKTKDGRTYSVMPLIRDFVTLQHYVRQGDDVRNSEAVAKIVTGVCSALDAIHSRSIIHGDLNPSNIILGKDERPLLIDFGFARPEPTPDINLGFVPPASTAALKYRVTHEYVARYLSSGGARILGAVGYHAPESAPDRRADIYSLGCVIYHLLTGRTPVGLYEKPSKVSPGTPSFWDEIVEKCVRWNPAERYSSAKELAADIERNLSIASSAQTVRTAYLEYSFASGILAMNIAWLLSSSLAVASVVLCGFALLSGFVLHRLARLTQSV